METNQNLKKRIAAGSIAALMALTGSIGIHKNHSDKIYAGTNIKKELTKEEAIRIYGEETVKQEEQKALYKNLSEEQINENLKEEVRTNFIMRKATISYETGQLAAIENFKKGTSNDAFDNEFYNEYAGYINEELYQQGVDRFTTIIEGYNEGYNTGKKTTNEVYKNTATESSDKGFSSYTSEKTNHQELDHYIEGYNAGKQFPKKIDKNADSEENTQPYVTMNKKEIDELYESQKAYLEEKWKKYISELQNPVVYTDAMSVGLSLAIGQYDGINNIDDYENNKIYQKYKDYINPDIYIYCYKNSNESGKRLAEYPELKSKVKGILDKQISDFDEHISEHGVERDKWVLYYSGLEVGYADEYYKINNQDEKVVGISTDSPLIKENIEITPNNKYYEGYYQGSDQRDRDYLEEKSKSR